MHRDDVKHALDALASEVPAPRQGAGPAIARGRRRLLQRRATLAGIAALLVAAVAVVAALSSTRDNTNAVSSLPRPRTTTSAAGVAVTPNTNPNRTTAASGPAPFLVPVSSSEEWICGDRLLYTDNGGTRWLGIDARIAQETVTNPQPPLCAAIPGGEAWVVSATAKPGVPKIVRVRRGGADVETFGFPRLSSGTTVVALTFVDSDHGWALTSRSTAKAASVDLYGTNDGGRTWAIVSHTPPLSIAAADESLRFTSTTDGWALAQSPPDQPDRTALEHTTNGGRTWSAVTVPALPAAGGIGNFLKGLFASGNQIVAWGGRSTGMLYEPFFDVSSDDGRTWSLRHGPNDTELPGTAPSPFSVVDALHWRLALGDLWVTDDGGITWVQRHALAKLTSRTHSVQLMAFSTPDAGLISGNLTQSQAPFVLRTIDAGRSWTTVSLDAPPTLALTPPQVIPIGLAAAPPREAWLCSRPLLYTADGGGNFANVAIANHPPIPPSDQRPLCAAVRGGTAWMLNASPDPNRPQLLRLTNGGAKPDTLTFPRLPDATNVFTMTFADARHGWAVTAPSEGSQVGIDLYATSDGGDTWSVIAHRPPPDIHFASATDGWASGEGNHLLHTGDGGRTWQPVAVPTPPPVPGEPVGVGPDLVTPSVIVADGSAPTGNFTQRFFDVSTDGGRSWTLRPGPAKAFGTTEPGAFAALDTDHWQLAAENMLWTTDDAGTTWTQVAQFAGIESITSVAFLTPEVGFVSGVGAAPDASSSVVLQTNDAGATWSIVDDQQPGNASAPVSTMPGGVIGCPTQPLTPAPPGNPPAGLVAAAIDNVRSQRHYEPTVEHAYRVGSNQPNEFGTVFTFNVGSCGKDVVDNSWVVEMYGPVGQGGGGSTAQAQVVLAHYADGWHVFGAYH